MAVRYDYRIATTEIIPPLAGGLRYAATVHIARFVDGLRVGEEITLGESYGVTAPEARQKAHAAAEQWIAEQGDE